MGTIHHGFAIAVVTYNSHQAAEAFEAVKSYAHQLDVDNFTNSDRFENLLVGPVEGVVNMTQTYFVAPDGSKEGWAASDSGDELRKFFVQAMRDAGASVAHGSFGELQNTFEEVL